VIDAFLDIICGNRKKMSSFSRSRDWRHAHNYVAKRYMATGVDQDVYFEDVRLQMDAKLWGEEYNRHNPPKKVGFSLIYFSKPIFVVVHLKIITCEIIVFKLDRKTSVKSQ